MVELLFQDGVVWVVGQLELIGTSVRLRKRLLFTQVDDVYDWNVLRQAFHEEVLLEVRRASHEEQELLQSLFPAPLEVENQVLYYFAVNRVLLVRRPLEYLDHLYIHLREALFLYFLNG